MPKIQVLNPLTYQGWNDLVVSTEPFSFFHSKSWAEVICESYNHKPYYFLLSDNNRKIALAPMIEIRSHLTGKRGVSLPFTDHCEPIYSEERYFADLLQYILCVGRKSGWKYVEIRGGAKVLKNVRPTASFFAHTLGLDRNVEKLFLNFRSSTRRNIGKAVREGVECKISRSLASVREFYRLNCSTRKMHGLPPQPFYFFNNIYNYVIAKKLGIVLLAFYGEKVIAGAIYFQFKDSVVYKYGASDKTFQHLRPNNLVMWKAIKWHAQKGYRLFDMGISEPNNLGLIRFKNGWGTKSHKVSYYRYYLKENSFVRSNSNTYSNIHADIHSPYRKFFSKMPLFALKTIGVMAYRHMG